MSWANKIHKQRQVDDLMKKIEQHPDFKQFQKHWTEEATYKAYSWFMTIACDYLFRNFNCKENGIKKFIHFAAEQFGYINEDETYFTELNEALKDDVGVDVYGMLQIDDEGIRKA